MAKGANKTEKSQPQKQAKTQGSITSWRPKKEHVSGKRVIKTADRASKMTAGFGNMNVISALDQSGSVETWEDTDDSEYQ